jgi:hypothetical protein
MSFPDIATLPLRAGARPRSQCGGDLKASTQGVESAAIRLYGQCAAILSALRSEELHALKARKSAPVVKPVCATLTAQSHA